jgi:hypothetical protein
LQPAQASCNADYYFYRYRISRAVNVRTGDFASLDQKFGIESASVLNIEVRTEDFASLDLFPLL